MSGFYRFCRAIAKVVVFVCYRVKVINGDKMPDGGIVLCSNHVAALDPVILGTHCKRQLCFMGKAELFKSKFTKYLFTKLGSFAVERGKNDRGAIKMAQNVVKSGGVFAIFPEGTRSKTGEIARAKPGAALVAVTAGGDILPVAIKYHTKKRKIFCKVTVKFGNLVKIDCKDSSREELRRISDSLTDTLRELHNEI
ncbi:MAG: 1-acyl-sn-glycerol-3-phosphate acyltransferase [Oscillospiraceae bacterium]|nr:1-acyl-sn-glycerol-3-phosphate acyltransferase [Candidatus Equicaccousia limihippi]